MNNDLSYRLNVKLDQGAYINLGGYIIFGIAEIFDFIPLILLSGVIAISIFNISFNSLNLRNCIKNKDSLSNYKRQRNTAIRIVALALCLILISIVEITTL
ncbi:MAG: hypothetical protein M0P69_16375 [Bacteroidales bacterium]|jgi:uncharacterized membrane protein|nr:hypothetical protein [Bacteroidales bacterium]MDD3386186.1 hypothetical protein [Bacteroidales bacterium]